MAYLTDYQYYTNAGASPKSKNWGSYQYVSLNDIVNNFMLMCHPVLCACISQSLIFILL